MRSRISRAEAVRLCVLGMLLSGIATSYRAWIPTRNFPLVPFWGGMPDLPTIGEFILSLALLAALVAATVLRKLGWIVYGVVGIALLLVAFDIERLQPWFYLGILLLIPIASFRSKCKPSWQICAFVFIATYFWSGLQKLNSNFAEVVFPWLLSPFKLNPPPHVWLIAPVAEVAVALLLSGSKTRSLGLLLLVLIHGTLLLMLGPAGNTVNSVIWPWNLWMPLLGFALFYRNPRSLIGTRRVTFDLALVAFLAGVMPGLNFVGLWDDYLSDSLYSGKSRQAFLVFSEAGAGRLPLKVRFYLRPKQGREVLDVARWGSGDLNLPPYPEPRIYRLLARRLQSFGITDRDIELLVQSSPSTATSPARFQRLEIR